MVTLTELREAQKKNPHISANDLLKSEKPNRKKATNQKTGTSNISGIVSNVTRENRSLPGKYPALARLLKGTDNQVSISKLVKKVIAKEPDSYHMTSIDREAQKLRESIEVPAGHKYHETSFDREKKQLPG